MSYPLAPTIDPAGRSGRPLPLGRAYAAATGSAGGAFGKVLGGMWDPSRRSLVGLPSDGVGPQGAEPLGRGEAENAAQDLASPAQPLREQRGIADGPGSRRPT